MTIKNDKIISVIKYNGVLQ